MASDADDVQARLRDSLSSAAARAYRAAHGTPLPVEARGVRWHIEPKVAIAIAMALFLAVLMVGMGSARGNKDAPTTAVSLASGDGTLGQVVVHVTGAVLSPGLETLQTGARVADAVDAAGGFTADADQSAINLARFVKDGEQVNVPCIGEAGSGLVNINRADAAELDALPGIGPVLAQRIVADRDANGPFSSLDDLGRVSGIGDAVLSTIAALATV
jgi:competence protein ComEA